MATTTKGIRWPSQMVRALREMRILVEARKESKETHILKER